VKNENRKQAALEHKMWIRNAPLETKYMLIIQDSLLSKIPWYVLEGEDIKDELMHFGRRIIAVFDLSDDEDLLRRRQKK